MSIQAIRQFNHIAENDLEIQQSLEATTDPQSLMNLTVELGSEKGFSFTANDLEQYYTQESRKVQTINPRNAAFRAIIREANESESKPNSCDNLPYLARQICLKLNS